MSFCHLIPMLTSPGTWDEIWACKVLHDFVSFPSPVSSQNALHTLVMFQLLGDWKTIRFFPGSGHLHMLSPPTGRIFSTLYSASFFRSQPKCLRSQGGHRLFLSLRKGALIILAHSILLVAFKVPIIDMFTGQLIPSQVTLEPKSFCLRFLIFNSQGKS